METASRRKALSPPFIPSHAGKIVEGTTYVLISGLQEGDEVLSARASARNLRLTLTAKDSRLQIRRVLMNTSEINRHILGGSALLAAILGLGIAASIRSTEPISSISTAQLTPQTEKWANPANQQWADPSASNFAPQLGQIPSNAYGSAQAIEPSGSGAMSENGSASLANANKTEKTTGASEAQNWTDREWEIASKAVSAYRMAGKAAQALIPNRSADPVWQPPEEIANGKGEGEKR
jgi:hypothetical protein